MTTSEHVCNQFELVVICDGDGEPDHEVCPDCGREFY